MKKFTNSLLVAVTLFAVSAALAADKDKPADVVQDTDHAAAMAKMEKMDGKDIFKNMCKSCHGPDAEAGEYTPITLIMDQWDDFFADTFAKAHKDITCPKDKSKKVTDIFTKKMLKKVQKFCVDHAADSEQPMTCG